MCAYVSSLLVRTGCSCLRVKVRLWAKVMLNNPFIFTQQQLLLVATEPKKKKKCNHQIPKSRWKNWLLCLWGSEITSCWVPVLARTYKMAARGGAAAPEHPVLPEPWRWVETQMAVGVWLTEIFTQLPSTKLFWSSPTNVPHPSRSTRTPHCVSVVHWQMCRTNHKVHNDAYVYFKCYLLIMETVME